MGSKDPIVPMWLSVDTFIYITKTNSMFATISGDPEAELDAQLSCTSTQQNKLLLASGTGREGDLLSTEQHLCFHNFLPVGLFWLLAFTGLKNRIKEAKEKVFQRMKLRIVKIFE